MTRCPTEQLEAYARGALGVRAEEARIAAHIEVCPRCAEEVAWLRAEKRLFEAREPELPPPPAFSEVLARMSSPARSPQKPALNVGRAPRSDARRTLRRAALPMALFAAAAAFALYFQFEDEPPVAVGPEPPSTASSAVDPQPPAMDPEVGHECSSPPGFECGSCPSPSEADAPAPKDDGSQPPLYEVCGNSDSALDFSVTCGGDRPLPD